MPRLALLSDIHGNLEALEAALADVQRVGVDRIVCLGDVVGYGPDPAACVDLVREKCDAIVRGNHDEALIEPRLRQRFNPLAQLGVEHARETLEHWRIDAIAAWAARSTCAGVELAHGSFSPDRFAYVVAAKTVGEAFGSLGASIGAVGHTHIPAVFSAPAPDAPRERLRFLTPPADAVVRLREGWLHIVNPGSVGQPRDRNPDASWALLDTSARTYQLRRVAYDVRAVEMKMRSVNLPEYLWARLRVGA